MAIRIILAGCGNMGHALLVGWLGAGIVEPREVAVVEPGFDLRQRAAGLGARVFSSAAELAGDLKPALVVFAIKPQIMREAVPEYARFTACGSTFLSVAAGISLSALGDFLGKDAAIIRCMPNTPASIGKGMLVLVSSTNVPPDARNFVGRLLAANGSVAEVETEDLMDAVTAVSGSGPAYLFHFIECLESAGRKAGLPGDIAAILALQTVFGAASLAAESPDAPAELRRQVTSPNGTTAAALDILMGNEKLEILMSEAVEAAKNRSIELGR